MMSKVRKKYAFISYNHYDVLWAMRLKFKMVWFKLPSYLPNEFKKSKYLEPVFRDRDFFTSGILPDMIKRQLDNSRYLIVICSPNSQKSDWVNQEVDYFLNEKPRTEAEANPLDYIIPYVLLDEPVNVDDCYPPALIDYLTKRNLKDKFLYIPKIDQETKETESLFAKLFPDSFKTEKSFARVIAAVLGFHDEFDDIWNIHLRMLKLRWKIRGAIAAVLMLIATFLLWPLTLSVNISDDDHTLPAPSDAMLYVNGIGYPLSTLDTTVTVKDLTWYFQFKEIPVSFRSTFYQSADTAYVNTLKAAILHHGTIDLKVGRDSTFAVYEGTVIDAERAPVEGAIVEIEGAKCVSDANGCFRIDFPVREQTVSKILKVSKAGYHALTPLCDPIEPTGGKEEKIEIIMIKDR